MHARPPSAKHEIWRKGSKSSRKTQVFSVLVRQLAEGGSDCLLLGGFASWREILIGSLAQSREDAKRKIQIKWIALRFDTHTPFLGRPGRSSVGPLDSECSNGLGVYNSLECRYLHGHGRSGGPL